MIKGKTYTLIPGVYTPPAKLVKRFTERIHDDEWEGLRYEQGVDTISAMRDLHPHSATVLGDTPKYRYNWVYTDSYCGRHEDQGMGWCALWIVRNPARVHIGLEEAPDLKQKVGDILIFDARETHWLGHENARIGLWCALELLSQWNKKYRRPTPNEILERMLEVQHLIEQS